MILVFTSNKPRAKFSYIQIWVPIIRTRYVDIF